MALITLESTCRRSVKAMLAAGLDYMKMTRGDAPWWAPESWFRDAVAQSIVNTRTPISLEETLSDLRARSVGTRFGRYPGGTGRGRVDLVVWNPKTITPRFIIEFKRSMAPATVEDNVDRLKKLTRQAKVKYGLLLTVDSYIRDNPISKIENIEKKFGIDCIDRHVDIVKNNKGKDIQVLYAAYRVNT